MNVEKYYGLVGDVVKKVLKTHSHLRPMMDDLYQIGCIGLLKAKDRYTNEYGTKFSTYARKRIIGEILDSMRKSDTITRCQRNFYNDMKKFAIKKGLPINEVYWELEFGHNKGTKYRKVLTSLEEKSQPYELDNLQESHEPDVTEENRALIAILARVALLNHFEIKCVEHRLDGITGKESATLLNQNVTTVLKTITSATAKMARAAELLSKERWEEISIDWVDAGSCNSNQKPVHRQYLKRRPN